MTTLFILTSIIQSFSISLGVGSSTLAITNFFAAIADGKIDETERRMMGIVYIVLRIAMVAILVTSVILISIEVTISGFLGLTAFAYGQIIVIATLYLNAALMTARIMPSTFGPAIQAGSWYTLGTLAALAALGITGFSMPEFLLGYLTWIVLAVSIVNGTMAILKEMKKAR